MDTNNAADKRRTFAFESARFFRYIPSRTRDTLTDEQRRDIAHTIFELQRNNPRILQEIYLENPFVANEKGSPTIRRAKRRLYLMLRTWWFSRRYTSMEARKSNRLGDFIFMFIVTAVSFSLVILLLVAGYMTKSAVGIDLMPGVHLFCTV